MGVRESTIRFINLQTRQTQIHEHGIHSFHALIGKHLIKLIKGRMNRRESGGKPLLNHTLSRQGQRLTITVNTDKTSLRRRFQESGGMTGKTQRAVHGHGTFVL